MAIRFRRTIKIAPGVRLNLGKTGVSARLGPRGAGVTVGTSGTRVSAGIPGTGVHVSERLSLGAKRGTAAVSRQPADTQPGLGRRLAVVVVLVVMIWGAIALSG